MAKLKFKKGYSDVGVFPLLSHVLKEGGLIVDDEDFELNPSTSLTGEEKVKILQDGKSVLTTTYDIANLAGGGGGGTSALFPNGIEFVSVSRDFQASDAGKRLFITGENTVISMPEDNPFAVGDYVGIINDGTNISFTTEYGGEPIFPLRTGGGSTSECVVLMNTEIEGSSWLFPISTAFIYDNTDSKKKTALRYLMDNAGNTGTATLKVAGTVTVADARVKTGAKIIVSVNTPDGTQGFLSAPAASIVDETSFVINSSSNTDTSTVNYWFVNP